MSLIDLVEKSMGNDAVSRINNGHCDQYQQTTPKKRILSALYDIKSQEQPVKERIVYVMVDEKVKQLVKDFERA